MRPLPRLRLTATLGLLLLSCRASPPDATRLRLTTARGGLNGFTQIPAGGNPGSTSHRRPELDELGLHRGGPRSLELEGRWGRGVLYAGLVDVDEQASRRLAKSLVSNDVSFPAGAQTSSDLSLDWLRLGAGRRWRLDDATDLTGLIEAALFSFSYRIWTPTGSSGGGPIPGPADRSFQHGALRLGGRVERKIGRGARLEAALFLPVPLGLSTEARITSAELAASLPLTHRGRLHARLLLGVRADRVHFRDDQEVPNLVEVDLGPAAFVGLEARF